MPRKLSRREALAGIAVLGALTGVVALIEGRFTPVAWSIRRALLPAPPMPMIVPRAKWGAVEPDHRAANEFGVTDDPKQGRWYVYPTLEAIYTTVVVHHSATLLFANETMRSLQQLHMEVNGWADVGYHYAIDKNGIVYEGRDIHVRGASVAGHNTGTIGVVVMGDFRLDEPLDAQLTALQAMIDWLAYRYGLTHLAGHSEFNPETVCPGKNLAVYLDTLAQAAGLERGTGGYVAPV